MSEDLSVRHFLNLFAIADLNHDGIYSSNKKCTMGFKDGDTLVTCLESKETGLINDMLYAELDSRDGVVGNGFSLKNFETTMSFYGLKGLSNFYPNNEFEYNKECDCIAVVQAMSLLRGDIPYSDERVHQIANELFDWSDQPTDVLKSIGGRISHVNYAGENAALLVVIEDLHLAQRNAEAVIKAVENILISRDELVLFQEFLDGPSVFDDAFARREWETGIKSLIEAAASTTERDDLKDYKEYDQTTATLRIVAKRELRKLMNKIDKKILLSIDYSNLKEAFVKYPELRIAVSTLSIGIYLKAMYGNRLTILNSEFHKPINNFSVNEERTSPLMPSLDGRQFFANDSRVRLIGTKEGVYDHHVDRLRLTDTFQKSLQGYFQWIDDRTDRWLYNILDVISNPEMSNGSPPVIVLFGGGAHMPKLSRELESRVSSIFLAAY